jgi:hypothetical protein
LNRILANLALADWRDVVPIAGLAVLAGAGAFFLFRKKPEDSHELERERRAYLNRVGRIVEGHILEVVDHANSLDAKPESTAEPNSASAQKSNQKLCEKSESKQPANSAGILGKRSAPVSNGTQKLLYYTYSISGVTYETAQDVTGLEEQAHLKRVSVGQSASVKYDPSNPSNSILLADDWSGIH